MIYDYHMLPQLYQYPKYSQNLDDLWVLNVGVVMCRHSPVTISQQGDEVATH